MELIVILLIVGALAAAEWFIYGRFSLKNIEYSVRFNTDEAFEGDTIEIVEEITNRKWLPIPWVKTELSTSRWLEFIGSKAARASDARFVPSVFALRPYQKCTRTRKAVALKRGVYTLESSSIIAGDIFGLVQASGKMNINLKIRILPAPYEVGEGELSSRELYGEIMTRRFICSDPFYRSGAREYTGNEPINRIHWSSTARQGKLMTYNNDFTTENRVLILINLQRSPLGEPTAPVISDTETMIKAAAFLLELCAQTKTAADLAVNGSGGIFAHGGSGSEDYMKLLRCLAELENTCDTVFEDFFERLDISRYTDIVLITPYLDERIYAILSRSRRCGANAVVYCNTDEFSQELQLKPLGRIHKYIFIND